MIGTFSPSNSALLLIDHQLGTMKLIKNIPLDLARRNTLALAKTAKILKLPVVLTSSQEENLQGPLMPELEKILPEAFAARIKRAGIVVLGMIRISRKQLNRLAVEISSWRASQPMCAWSTQLSAPAERATKCRPS
jgi:hypothetical protein